MNEQYKYEVSDSNQLMPEGDYEVRIDKIERKVLNTGKEKLTIQYRVRNDVEQSYKNKVVFEDIWEEKLNKGIFNRKRINQLLGTQDLKDGTIFENINKIISFLTNVNLIIHVKQEYDDYYQENVNKVAWYKSSQDKKQVQQIQTNNATNQNNDVIINEDDLPF